MELCNVFLVYAGLVLLFTSNTMGTLTESDKQQNSSNMVLSEESPIYVNWKSPSARPSVKIYIFNYTNVNDFERGYAQKLHVEEVGPYVYFEQLERVNINFNEDNGTVSYQEKRTYIFSEELSKGSRDDLVIVPNVPFLSGIYLVKFYNLFVRFAFSSLLSSLSQKPFVALGADEFINGYENNFYDLTKGYLKLQDKKTSERVGLLVGKAGLQPDIFTMNTGAHNITKIGQIESFNGQSQVNLWRSDSCNNIQASDGVLYPPQLVRSKQDLSFFVPQMCRKLTLQFEKEATVLDNVPVYRYRMPLDLFDSAQDNECYCNKQNGACPPQGLFNNTLCSFGAPIFYSWPYFYNADPALKNAISGLEKNSVFNDTFADILANDGRLLRGKVKFQVNIQLQKSFGISQLNHYPDSLMLPIAWVETELSI